MWTQLLDVGDVGVHIKASDLSDRISSRIRRDAHELHRTAAAYSDAYGRFAGFRLNWRGFMPCKCA